MKLGVGDNRTLRDMRSIFVGYVKKYGYSHCKTAEREMNFWDRKARIYLRGTLLRLFELYPAKDFLIIRSSMVDRIFEGKKFCRKLRHSACLTESQAEVAEVATAVSLLSYALYSPVRLTLAGREMIIVLNEAERIERQKQSGVSNFWLDNIEDYI
ncbi:MAG: hypothetical protein Q7S19_00075 [bacterium]|nr:hypothetical protein [bacterium]